VPVAFVFTGKTEAQRESRMRRLEQSARRYFAGTPHRGEGFTAVDYHQAVPVVVTELERITADPAGAAGAVWRRLGRDEWQTLSVRSSARGSTTRLSRTSVCRLSRSSASAARM
jgi:hypothetical protein